MLTQIILILALAAGALVVNGHIKKEMRYESDDTLAAAPYMTQVEESEAVEKVTTRGMEEGRYMEVMLHYKQDIMVIKPSGERCIIVDGILSNITKLHEASKEDAKQSVAGGLIDVDIPLVLIEDDKDNKDEKKEATDVRKKLSDEMIRMCTASSKTNEVNELIVTRVAADGEKRDALFYNWWPWWGWWYWNRCHYCNYYKPYFYYYWPCYRWPYWFYYWRFRFIIMWY